MQNTKAKRIIQSSFLLSLLLHLLLFFSFALVVTFFPTEEKKKPPHMYVPSYVYKGEIKPSHIQNQSASHTQKAEKSTVTSENSHPLEKTLPFSTLGLEHANKKSLLEMSRDVIREEQMQESFADHENIEPILLIGDKNTPADPLIRLLAKSLSANLIYPKIEGYLGARGRVLVAMVLHPEGNFTNVQIIQSSDNPNFDNAALFAVNRAPDIPGAKRFLSKPKYFVVGFIFSTRPPPE